ncbi:MAG: hypothetical protein U9N14_07245 [Pseudomonadota bacterium]|nr:hypothetical protein [Pseudomonadota bacterium]
MQDERTPTFQGDDMDEELAEELGLYDSPAFDEPNDQDEPESDETDQNAEGQVSSLTKMLPFIAGGGLLVIFLVVGYTQILGGGNKSPAPVAPTMTFDPYAATAPAQPVPAPAKFEPIETEPVAAKPVVDSSALAAIEARLDGIETRQKNLSLRFSVIDDDLIRLENTLAKKPSSTGSVSGVSKAELDSLARTLRIEIESVKKHLTNRLAGVRDEIADIEKTVAPIAPAKKPVAVAKPVSAPVTAEPTVADTVSKRWVLSSISRGQAYLRDTQENTLKRVHVGDIIPGLGTIIGVGRIDGRWTVQGTEALARGPF